MSIIKSTKFSQPFNSNYWTIVEFTLLVIEKKLNIVVRWFISEEQRGSDGLSSSSDFKVLYFDTEKKFNQVEVMKMEEFVEWDLVSPETYNEDWTIKDQAVYTNLRPVSYEVWTWVFNEVWSNEKTYIELPEEGISLAWCYDIVKKTEEFAWSDDVK